MRSKLKYSRESDPAEVIGMWVCSDRTACSMDIETGAQEFEWTNPGDLMVFFHERCAEIYRALKDGYAGDGHGGGGLAGR